MVDNLVNMFYSLQFKQKNELLIIDIFYFYKYILYIFLVYFKILKLKRKENKKCVKLLYSVVGMLY